MSRPLTPNQQAIVDQMRRGWRLWIGAFGPYLVGRKRDSVNVHLNTVRGLIRRKTIRPKPSDPSRHLMREWVLTGGE